MTVKVRIIKLDDPHEDVKWVVLSAIVEGAHPSCEIRRAINSGSLSDGTGDLDRDLAEVKAAAEEYHGRWLAKKRKIDAIKAELDAL